MYVKIINPFSEERKRNLKHESDNFAASHWWSWIKSLAYICFSWDWSHFRFKWKKILNDTGDFAEQPKRSCQCSEALSNMASLSVTENFKSRLRSVIFRMWFFIFIKLRACVVFPVMVHNGTCTEVSGWKHCRFQNIWCFIRHTMHCKETSQTW